MLSDMIPKHQKHQSGIFRKKTCTAFCLLGQVGMVKFWTNFDGVIEAKDSCLVKGLWVQVI